MGCPLAEHLPLPKDVTSNANHKSVGSVGSGTHVHMGTDDAVKRQLLSMDNLPSGLGLQKNCDRTVNFRSYSLPLWLLLIMKPFFSVMIDGFYREAGYQCFIGANYFPVDQLAD